MDEPAQNISIGEEYKIPSLGDRALSVMFDYAVLLPLISLFLSPLLSRAISQYQLGVSFLPILAVSFTGFCLWILIQTFSLYYWSATLGQKIFRIKVVSYPGAFSRLSFNQCLYRSAAWSVSILMLGLPFFEVLTHPKRRSVVDRISDTLVTTLKVQGDPGPHPIEARYLTSLGRLVFGMAILGLVANVQSSFTVVEALQKNSSAEICQGDLATAYLYYTQGHPAAQKCFAEKVQNLVWQEGAPVEAYVWHYLKAKSKENQEKYGSIICEQSLYECELLKALKGEDYKMPPYVSTKAYVFVTLAEYFYNQEQYAKALAYLEKPYADTHFFVNKKDSVLEGQMIKYVFSYLSQASQDRAPASQKSASQKPSGPWLEEFKKRYDLP